MHSNQIKNLEALLQQGEGSFLMVADTLRRMVDEDSGAIKKITEHTDLKARKLYCLLRIARTFGPLNLDEHRLTKIGWAKLDLISRYVEPKNIERYLSLAEENSPARLSRILGGEKVSTETNTIQLHFEKDEYALFCDAISKAGATSSGRGHIGKEKALIAILKGYMKSG